jgi:hypothetical protein
MVWFPDIINQIKIILLTHVLSLRASAKYGASFECSGNRFFASITT